MGKLIFFLGPAGAGKTTLAKALARKRGGALLDMDTLLRPAAEAIMKLAGQDPQDRDSPVYKQHCRDLGYRIVMDAALENVELGLDAYVIGPFTRELEDAEWLGQELSRLGASSGQVEVHAIYVYLADEEHYRNRLKSRGSKLDAWKLDHWEAFRSSLVRRHIRWPLPSSSILYLDNSSDSPDAALAIIERCIYG